MTCALRDSNDNAPSRGRGSPDGVEGPADGPPNLLLEMTTCCIGGSRAAHVCPRDGGPHITRRVDAADS